MNGSDKCGTSPVTDGSAPTPPYECKITDKEIVEAVANEIARINNMLYALQDKVRKYERVFEQLFRQEAEERLGIAEKTKLGGYEQGYQPCMVSQLEQIKLRMNRQ